MPTGIVERVNGFSERFIAQGPLRLALFMLLGIILLPVQSADATVPDFGMSQGEDLWQRYGLQSAMRYRSSGTTDCGNMTTGIATWSFIITTMDGNFSTGLDPGGTPGTPCGDTNFPLINITLPVNLTSTTAHIRITCAGGSSGYSFVALNESFGWLAKTDFACPGNGQRMSVYLNTTVISLRHWQIVHNTCCAVGVFPQLTELHFYDSSTTNSQYNYSADIAYLNYLSSRAERRTFTASDTTFETNTSKPVLFPPGNGIYYTTALSRERSFDIFGNNREYLTLIPTSSSPDLTFRLIAASYAQAERLQSGNQPSVDTVFTLWEYTNSALTQRSVTLRNTTVTNAQAYAFATMQFQEGALFHHFPSCNGGTEIGACWVRQDASTIPFGNASCVIGTCHASRPYMLGFGYKNNTAYNGLVGLSSAGFGCFHITCPMDLTNATLTGAPAFVTDGMPSGEITLSLEGDNRHKYVGNALILVLAKISPTNLCQRDLVGAQNPNSTIKVNGADAILAVTTGADVPTLGNVWFCGWVIDDFTKTQAISLDAFGNNRYHDNGINASRVYNIVFPPSLAETFSTNARVLTGFLGRGSERIICHGDTAVCSGNLDTGGFGVPGAISRVSWEWVLQDEETGSVISGARIVETVSSNVVLTNINGFAVINTTSENIHWSVTASGYQPLSLNWTFVTERPLIYMNYTLSRISENVFHTHSCSMLQGGSLACAGNATSDASSQCNEVGGNDGLCNAGPIFGVGLRQYQFGCPVDGSSSGNVALANVTFREWNTGTTINIGSGSFGINNNLRPMDCLTGTTTAIQIVNPSITLSRFGYRNINFEANWLTNNVIKIVPVFKTGSGNATSVTVSASNGTIYVGSIAKSITYVTLTDNEAASLPVGANGVPGFATSVVALGAAFGFGDAAGKAIWGIFFIIALVMFLILLWYNSFKSPPPPVIIAVPAIGGYAIAAFVGLFPGWLNFLLIAGIMLGLFVTAKASTARQGE